MFKPRCKHKWVLVVPRIGKCYRSCTLCDKTKKKGCNG